MTENSSKDAPPTGGGASRSFYEFTAKRPIAITMVVLSVMLFGLVSFKKLRLNLLPEVSYPTITVRTEYPGAAPEDVEERVSERLQEALATTPNLVRLYSVSRAETSDIVLELNWGTRVTFAMQDVREKIDRVFLPQEAQKPILLRYDPNLDPVLRIGVSGEPDLRKLRRLVRDELKRELEGLPGVAAVRVRGGLEDEVRVAVDTRELTKRNLPFDTVAKRLREENLNAAGGKLEEGDTEFLVRTLNQFRTVEDIANVVLATFGDAEVRLKDVARVEPFHRDRDVIVRIGGAEAVELAIFREAEANIVDVAKTVQERLFGSEAQKKWIAEYDAGVIQKKWAEADAKFAEKQNPTKEEIEAQERAVRQRKVDVEANSSFLQRKLGNTLTLTPLSDQSRFILDAIDDVNSSAIIGGVLSALIMYLYLKKFFDTAIINLSVPISIIAAFAPMYLFGVSLNIMSLGGLALAIGMVVDDATVALESITRCREEGDGIVRAAVRGISEVAGAVVASSLTAMAVFFPIIFVEGVAGQLFGDLALTVVVSRIISLLFALFFIPMLASREMKLGAGAPPSVRSIAEGLRWTPRIEGSLITLPLRLLWWLLIELVGNIFVVLGRVVGLILSAVMALVMAVLVGSWKVFQFLFLPFQWLFDVCNGAMERSYPVLLRASLKARLAVIAAAVIAMAVTSWRIPNLKTVLLPDVHQGEFTAEIYLDVRTPVEGTDLWLRPVAAEIAQLPEVEQVIATSGVERDAITNSDEGDHTGKLAIRMRRGPNLAEREEALIALVRDRISSRPEVRDLRFKKPTLFSLATPIEIEIRGRSLETLGKLSAEVKKVLESEPSLKDVRTSMRRGNPEVAVKFRRDEMLRYGLDASAASKLLRSAVLGDVATTFVDGDQRVDVRVRAVRDEVSSLERLSELAMNPGQATPIPLKAVADLELRDGPAEIRRIGNMRAAIVTATSEGIDLGGLSDRLAGKLAAIPRPTGYDIEIGGQKREMERGIASMQFAFLLSVFLVYIVMAAQFESIVQPLVILVTVPLSVVGLVPTLELTGMPISVVALLGVILLGGVVVSNAIVLLDRANQNRAAGMEGDEALIEAGTVRLRPILITALTTILGLLPMTGWFTWVPYIGQLGAGEGAELRAPMAVVIVAGLTSSTILTLGVIPVVDSLVHDFGRRRKKSHE